MALGRWLSVGLIAVKRLASNVWLSACLVLGVAVTVAVSVAIPDYSVAASTRVLWEELGGLGRPPFSFLYRYRGENAGTAAWERLEGVDGYLTRDAPLSLGLPLMFQGAYVGTDLLEAFPAAGGPYGPEGSLGWMSVGSLTGLEEEVRILEGRFPRSAPSAGTPLEVLVTQAEAERLGLQVGDDVVLLASDQEGSAGPVTKVEIPLRVAGVWVPIDASDPFWFYPPPDFDDTFLAPLDTFRGAVASILRRPVYEAAWYSVYNTSGVDASDIPRLMEEIRHVSALAGSLDPDVRAMYTPLEALEKHQKAAYDLLILLYVFSLPVLGLLLYFIVLVSTMIVQRQANEFSLLRSRGSSRGDVLSMHLLGCLVLGGSGAALGACLGPPVARLMGAAVSFLRFGPVPASPTGVTGVGALFGLGAALVSVLIILVPAVGESRHTIVTYKQERARSLRRPLWQRSFLDLLLLIPLGYGYLSLRRRGTLGLVEGSAVSGDPFSNPILFLVPTLYVFCLGMIMLRLFPPLMEALGRMSRRLRGAPVFLAIRALARSSGHYDGPLLLLILTTGLASLTASMARTLDGQIVDRAYYETGGDFLLAERGEMKEEPATTDRATYWEFVPVFQYAELEGIHRALRVADYKVSVRWSEAGQEGHLVGVDPAEFHGVRSFRADYSPFPLELVTAVLAARPSGLFVDRRFYQRERLGIGDTLRLTASLLGDRKEIEFVVAGYLDYFPTVYPEDGPIFLANLGYLFEQAGGLYHYGIWLDTDPGWTTERLGAALADRGLPATIQGDARRLIREETARPQRQGVYGLLSAGFAGCALLTALAFLVHFLLSFQRRSIELGVLRSIGLSTPQMVGLLVGEQLAMVLVGVAAGTLLGVSSSYLFVPFLQVGSGGHPHTPPFVVRLAWGDIGAMLLVFAAALVAAIAMLVLMLRRMRIFQAVKLEEVT